MTRRLPCGCVLEDEITSTVHEDDGKHYPIGAGPDTLCARCDMYRPCLCVRPEPPEGTEGTALT